MAIIDDYNQELPEIEAIAADDVMTPPLPVDYFLQEAEELYDWSLTDQTALTGAGLNAELITDMKARIGACRQAQSVWKEGEKSQEAAKVEWDEKSPLAFDLHAQLLHDFRYAYRNKAHLISLVRDIAEGNSQADKIQDLNDLSVMGKNNPDELTTINFDTTKLDQAATYSSELGTLLGTVNGDRKETRQLKVLRDRAYTHLRVAVDEIRGCGKYVFWRNPDRLKGYLSSYYKKKGSSESE